MSRRAKENLALGFGLFAEALKGCVLTRCLGSSPEIPVPLQGSSPYNAKNALSHPGFREMPKLQSKAFLLCWFTLGNPF